MSGNVRWICVFSKPARDPRQQGQVLHPEQGGGLSLWDTQGGDGASQQFQVSSLYSLRCGRATLDILSVGGGEKNN